jgi:homocysteine S-methyltransferase
MVTGRQNTGNYGDISHNGLFDFYERKVKILLEEKPDILAFETIPCFRECDAVVAVLKAIVLDSSTLLGRTTTWLSFACRDGCTLNDGTHISRVLDYIDRLDPNCDYVHGIGINCCSFVHGK